MALLASGNGVSGEDMERVSVVKRMGNANVVNCLFPQPFGGSSRNSLIIR